MAIKDTTKLLEHCEKLKVEVLDRIKTVEENYNKSNNEILASVLNDFYETDTYTADSVVGEFDPEHISEDIELFSYGNEKIQKKFKINADKYEKEKAKIKAHIIGLIKQKERIVALNNSIIEELENEITSRKKRLCKINEEKTADEQAITDMTQELKNTEKDYVEKSEKFKTISSERIKLIAELSKSDLKEDERAELQTKLDELNKEYGPLEKEVNELINSRKLLEQNIEEKKLNLPTYDAEINGLKIDELTEQLSKAKEGNNSLETSIEQDKAEYIETGLVTEKDFETPEPTPEKGSPNSPETPETKDQTVGDKGQPAKGQQQNGSQVIGSSVSAPATGQNLPVSQTPEERTQAVYNNFIGNSDDNVRNMLATSSFAPILANLKNCSKKEKKLLLGKLDSLNSPMDVARLSSVITALQRSGMCSDLDIKSLITPDGKLRDLGSLDNASIDSLKQFMTDLDKNKEFINDDQLDFLQTGFLTNIRANSLAQSLKPKKFRDFFKSKAARNNDAVRRASLDNLSTTVGTFPPKETPHDAPANFDDILRQGTRDEIDVSTPTKIRTAPSKGER